MGNKLNQYHPQTVSHPGTTLLETLEELEIGPKEFAVRADKPEKTISAIIKGKSSITADMAVKFEAVLKIPASFWTARQNKYDEYLARVKREKEIEDAIDWAKQFPYAKMANFGWITKTIKAKEKVVALFDYFGISTHKAWEAYYFNQELKLNFRISLAHTNEATAVSAWLRRGELQAQQISAPDYNATKFKKSLFEIKTLMANHPANLFTRLQEICLKSGVKVIYTPCLPKAPISGATRWIGDSPLIQLSARYKTNDIFWFTFFHEVGHILLHGKKYISIENITYGDQDKIKEREADEFAIEYTFSEAQENEVLSYSNQLSEAEILNFAEKFNTHPALIIGRFHKKRLLPYNKGRQYIESINLDE